jgi:hypothetical protein
MSAAAVRRCGSRVTTQSPAAGSRRPRTPRQEGVALGIGALERRHIQCGNLFPAVRRPHASSPTSRRHQARTGETFSSRDFPPSPCIQAALEDWASPKDVRAEGRGPYGGTSCRVQVFLAVAVCSSRPNNYWLRDRTTSTVHGACAVTALDTLASKSRRKPRKPVAPNKDRIRVETCHIRENEES